MPSEIDTFDANCWIRVIGGKRFHLLNDSIAEIDITAIAGATSRLCRFTGHLVDGVEIYSVAEHSVLVSYILEKMGAPPEVQFEGLMHDSSEAYLADIAAPFKAAIGNYYSVEERVMDRIKERYLLPRKFDYRVKLADWYALFIEARQVMGVGEDELKTWTGYEEHGEKSAKYQTPVQCWLPSMAKVQFLMRFAQLNCKMMGGGR